MGSIYKNYIVIDNIYFALNFKKLHVKAHKQTVW